MYVHVYVYNVYTKDKLWIKKHKVLTDYLEGSRLWVTFSSFWLQICYKDHVLLLLIVGGGE